MEKMFEYLINTPDAIMETVSNMKTIPRQENIKRRVIYLGMGGSAIAGDLASAVLSGMNKLGITVRGYELPSWVTEDDLVVAVSYSGNTEETISSLSQAIERGIPVIGISSGGKVASIMKKCGGLHIQVPEGYPPRSAVGYLFPSALLAVLTEGEFDGAVNMLSGLSDKLGRWIKHQIKEGSEAYEIARAFQNRIPFIYGGPGMEVVSRRWATQFNENSKILAIHGALPEMNHNEIVGWSGERPHILNNIGVIILDDGENPRIVTRIDFLSSLLMEKGVYFRVIRPEGNIKLEKLFYNIVIGDAASIHLALLRDVEPEPVEVISLLKNKLAGLE